MPSGPGRIRTDDLLLAKQAPSRLATGPVADTSADERTRTSTPLRAIDPKSIASANSATSASVAASCPASIVQSGLANQSDCRTPASPRQANRWKAVYPRFCLRSRPKAPRRSSSVSGLRPAACDLPGVTRHCPHRCDEILHHLRRQCKTHSPCSRLHARPAGPVSGTAGGLLPHRFTPYRPGCSAAAGRRVCFLLRL